MIYAAIKAGEFGKVSGSVLDEYRRKCNKIWPHANVFQDDETLTMFLNQALGSTSSETNELARQLESAKINENEIEN
jgi:hypothetical protein